MKGTCQHESVIDALPAEAVYGIYVRWLMEDESTVQAPRRLGSYQVRVDKRGDVAVADQLFYLLNIFGQEGHTLGHDQVYI
jgi:hypothetical protein